MVEKILRGPELKLPKVSFGQILYNGLQNGRNLIAMIDAVSGDEITYRTLLQETVSLAQFLKQWGLKKLDVISISSENTLNFHIPVISAFYLGITVAPLNHLYTEREMIHALNISKPKVIFCNNNMLEKIIKVSKKVKYVQKVVVINSKCEETPESIIKMENLFNIPANNFKITEVDIDDVCAILCSSGTTGLPKGVMLTHKGFNSTVTYLKHNGFGNYSRDKTAMCLLPLYHAYGFISSLCMISTNMKIVILPRFEEKLFLKSIQDYGITYAALVPPLILFLSKNPLVDNYNLSSFKEIISGAAPLGKDVQDAVIKRLNVNIRQGYGLTESTLAVTIQPYNLAHSGSVGILVPGMECKIIDTETGESLGPNKDGELCFRGSSLMKGYANDPKATAATIDKDGWLHTGDVGFYDQNELLYIVDRYKELIKYKGFQVPPAEIEGILLSHPEILDCGVVGKPDDEAGELPVAFVVKKPNSKLTEKEIYDFVAKNVSSHKKLHGGVKFVDFIPKNPTGKILRRVLREQVKKLSSKL